MELTPTSQWRTSTYSGDHGGNCVQAAVWRKSTRSGDNGGHCVEVTLLPAEATAR